MKSLVQAVVVAAALVAPVVSFAQSGSTITRAQVRAELVQLQQAVTTPPVAKIRIIRKRSRPQRRVSRSSSAVHWRKRKAPTSAATVRRHRAHRHRVRVRWACARPARKK